MRVVSLLLMLAACKQDYGVNPNTDEGGGPVDDTDWRPPIDTQPEEDDSAVVEPEDKCDDRSLPGEAIAQDEACYSEPAVGTFTPTMEWTNTSIGDSYVTPVVGQLTDDNGDGKVTEDDMPDIVVANTYGTLYVMSGDGSGTHWTYAMGGSEPGTPAIGDVNSDGWPDIVGAGATGLFAVDGQTGSKLWSADLSSMGYKAYCSAVAIHDMDGDGAVEVIVGRLIYDGATGKKRGEGSSGYGTGDTRGPFAAISAVADLDLDGEMEVHVGNAAYDPDGNTLWANGEKDAYVAFGNFDSDPEGEIVACSAGELRLQEHDGTLIWRSSALSSSCGAPTVADFDGDGLPEIGIAGHASYLVVETDGSELWRKTVNDGSSGYTGSAVFDFEGDGQAEVVYADEQDLWVFDGASGKIKLKESRHSSATCTETPAVADVDNDGHAEIVYTSSAYTGSETGVSVVGDTDNSWQKGRGVWNQHSYYITNVEDDLSIPTAPSVNWATYNNFRSGDLNSGAGFAQEDLIVVIDDVCTVFCEAGQLFAWGRVGNRGYADTTVEVEVVLWALTPDGWKRLGSRNAGIIVAGQLQASVAFELSGLEDWEISDLKMTVDGGNDAPDGGEILECDETNNEDTWGDYSCP